jgi:hypothetical protein
MIRRDYILRMIEEFMQALARLDALKKEQRWQEAGQTVDEQVQRLIGAGSESLEQLSETELLAQLIASGPTQSVRDKTLMLTTLLKEAGDLAIAQNRTEAGQSCYLKGLHLLLEILGQGEVSEMPAFVPQVELFAAALRDSALPLHTLARLMAHYERTGQFDKAENALFAMLDSEPGDPRIVDFGFAFYQRLQAQTDAALAGGSLPRAELEAGLAELKRRRAAKGADV